ncbi:unnamed protein product [Rhizophagus irregularis]|nr:unnamed protein product [Rhizophagus irregularis]
MAGYFNELSDDEKAERPSALVDETVKFVHEIQVMRPMTDPELRGIIFDGIVAGTDSTANTISFIIYYLAHYPDVKKKMLNEIDRIFQDDKTRPITENDIHNLKYCEAIVKAL